MKYLVIYSIESHPVTLKLILIPPIM